MNAKEFEANETRILGEMEETGRRARESGLVSKVPRTGCQAGYFLYLTHNGEIQRWVENFSREVSEALPRYSVIDYDRGIGARNPCGNIHTTLASFDIKTYPDRADFSPDYLLLRTLCEVGEEAVRNFWNAGLEKEHRGPKLGYYDFIHDESTVIAKPFSEGIESYCRLQDLAMSSAQQRKISMKPAKMRHITVARFSKDVSKEELTEFKALITRGPKEYRVFDSDRGVEPNAASLSAGYFILDNSYFELHPIQAFHFDKP